MNYQWETQRMAFYASIFTFIASLAIEFIFRKYKKRKIKNIQ
jgi:hypothetical protein